MRSTVLAILIALSVGAAVVGWAQRADALADVAYADSVTDAAILLLDVERARADSLALVALERDTVLVRIVDSVRVVIAEAHDHAELADASLASAADSLSAHLATDTLGTRLLDRIVTDHATTRAEDGRVISALRVQLGATEEAAALWRGVADQRGTALAAADSTIAGLEAAQAARDRVISPPGWFHALDVVPDWAWFAAGVAIGAGVTR